MIVTTFPQIAPSDNQIPRGAIVGGDEKEKQMKSV